MHEDSNSLPLESDKSFHSSFFSTRTKFLLLNSRYFTFSRPFLDTIIFIVFEKSRNARSRVYLIVLKVIQKHPRPVSSLRTNHLFYSSIPTFPLNLSSFRRCNIVKIIDPLEIILLGRQAILNVLVSAARKAMKVQQVSPS